MLLKLQPAGEQASVSFTSTTAGNSSTCEGQPALQGGCDPTGSHDQVFNAITLSKGNRTLTPEVWMHRRLSRPGVQTNHTRMLFLEGMSDDH